MRIDRERRLLADLDIADVRLVDLRHDLLLREVGDAHDDGRIVRSRRRHRTRRLGLADDDAADRSLDDRLSEIGLRLFQDALGGIVVVLRVLERRLRIRADAVEVGFAVVLRLGVRDLELRLIALRCE